MNNELYITEKDYNGDDFVRYDFVITRLANEYISKIKCCDECFCESWCIENGTKESRVPYKGCECNITKYLAELFKD